MFYLTSPGDKLPTMSQRQAPAIYSVIAGCKLHYSGVVHGAVCSRGLVARQRDSGDRTNGWCLAYAVEHMNANTGGGWGCLVSARTLTKHNFRDKTKLVSHAIVSVIHRRRYTVSVENGDFGTIGSSD